jgi:hypothetical protein
LGSPVSEAEHREVTANVSRNGANAIMVEGTPEAMTNRALITNLIGAERLPAIYTIPEFVDAGHLMACSFDVAELNKRAANNIDAILRRAIRTRSSSFPSTSRPRRRLASTSRRRSWPASTMSSNEAYRMSPFGALSGRRCFANVRFAPKAVLPESRLLTPQPEITDHRTRLTTINLPETL